jgi:pentose-5-phosphate-3-epimerase
MDKAVKAFLDDTAMILSESLDDEQELELVLNKIGQNGMALAIKIDTEIDSIRVRSVISNIPSILCLTTFLEKIWPTPHGL